MNLFHTTRTKIRFVGQLRKKALSKSLKTKIPCLASNMMVIKNKLQLGIPQLSQKNLTSSRNYLRSWLGASHLPRPMRFSAARSKKWRQLREPDPTVRIILALQLGTPSRLLNFKIPGRASSSPITRTKTSRSSYSKKSSKIPSGTRNS